MVKRIDLFTQIDNLREDRLDTNLIPPAARLPSPDRYGTHVSVVEAIRVESARFAPANVVPLGASCVLQTKP